MTYGRDTWCDDSLRPGRLASPAQTVLLALYRRLITPRGMLRGGDDEDVYGIDLAGYVGSVGYDTAIGALPGVVSSELLKDDRVVDVSVTVDRATDSAGLIMLTLTIDVTLSEDDEQFTLSIGVNDTSVALLGGVAA